MAPSSPVRYWLLTLLGTPLRLQSYRNLVYIGVLFVLVTAYSVVLTTLVTVGLTLSVYLVGIAVLAALPIVLSAIGCLERFVIRAVVGVDIRPASTDDDDRSYWARYHTLLTDWRTWGLLVYLFVAFSFATLSFGVLAGTVATATSFLLAPLYYRDHPVGVYGPVPRDPVTLDLLFGWDSLVIGLRSTFQLESLWIESAPGAIGVAICGCVLYFVALVLASGFTKIWIEVASRLLVTPRYWPPLRSVLTPE